MKHRTHAFVERSRRALGLLVTAGLAGLSLAAPARGAERAKPRATSQPSRTLPSRAATADDSSHERRARPVVDACVAHYTDAQELRMSGRLLESRAEMRSCAAEACPAIVQRDCVSWLDAIETQLPSITVRVTLDGRRTDGRVSIDGELRPELTLGKAIELNPGKHRVRCELPGLSPFEEEFITSEGERYRMLEVALSSAGASVRVPGAGPIEQHRPVPLLSYMLGGVAIAAAINGGIWGASSLSLRQELADTCAPACPGRRVDALRLRALITDLSWGVSALSLIGASAVFVLRPELPVEVDVSWLPGGGMGRVRFVSF
jgi:hypothetical protein